MTLCEQLDILLVCSASIFELSVCKMYRNGECYYSLMQDRAELVGFWACFRVKRNSVALDAVFMTDFIYMPAHNTCL